MFCETPLVQSEEEFASILARLSVTDSGTISQSGSWSAASSKSRTPLLSFSESSRSAFRLEDDLAVKVEECTGLAVVYR